jgi:hypothetical protein
MAGEVNYKAKYMELRAKYMNAVDVAFRLGFEEGSKQSQIDQANQQMQQAAAAPPGGEGGAPGAEPGKPNNNGAAGTPDQGAAPDKSGAPSVQPTPSEGVAAPAPMKESENPDGSELDQYIQKLESMLKKSENPLEDMQKSLDEIKSIRENMKFQAEMKKSYEAIPAIAKALHKPAFKFGVQAEHNLTANAKSAVTMHHKIVSDVMQKWEQEEAKADKGILAALSVEGITKGE